MDRTLVTIIVLDQSQGYFWACQHLFVVVYFGVGSCGIIRDVAKGRLLAISLADLQNLNLAEISQQNKDFANG